MNKYKVYNWVHLKWVICKFKKKLNFVIQYLAIKSVVKSGLLCECNLF